MVELKDLENLLKNEKTPMLITDLSLKLKANWYTIVLLLFKYLVEEINKDPEFLKKLKIMILKKGRYYFIVNNM
jgi:hypothetical protein